ncbi:MAG: lipopolysaccharide assembly LapA domain-containing protein [Syntrophales bacterium]
MKFIYTIILMIVVFFAITFSMQNTGMIPLSYYNLLDFQVPIYLLIFISFFAGIIFSGFMGMVERFKLSRHVSRLKKEIKGLESELYEIRKAQLMQQSPTPAVKDEYLS